MQVDDPFRLPSLKESTLAQLEQQRYNRAGNIETVTKDIIRIGGPACITYGVDARLRIEKEQVVVIRSNPLFPFRTVITHLQDGYYNEKSVICTAYNRECILEAFVRQRFQTTVKQS